MGYKNFNDRANGSAPFDVKFAAIPDGSAQSNELAGAAGSGERLTPGETVPTAVNGHSGNTLPAAAPANVIAFPGAVACADLPVVAPKAVSGFDYPQALRHIALLEPRANEPDFHPMHISAFDDVKERKSRKLTGDTLTTLLNVATDAPFQMRRKDGGTFWKEGFLSLQSKGAGLFLAVNAMKGDRRGREYVSRFRAIFCEIDNEEGKSLEEILKTFPIAPSLIIESSPNKYHIYWFLVEDWPATPENEKLWYGIQLRLVLEYGGDENAYDSARVLRLAGSLYQKREPWRVRIVEEGEVSGGLYAFGKRYTIAELKEAFPPEEIEGGAAQADAGLDAPADPIARQLWEAGLAQDWARVKGALRYIFPDCLRGEWIRVGMALRSQFGDDAYALWDAWSETGYKYPGSEKTWEDWDSFAKPGDRRARGGVALATIFFFAKKNGWPHAPAPQWTFATGPHIAPEGVRKGGPIRVPSMLSPASGAATASEEALPAPAAVKPVAEASTQAAPWMDMPSPFAAAPGDAGKEKPAKFPLERYGDIKVDLIG